jgi:cold-inducible RNA-binding protein
MSNKLFVGGISWDTKEEDLQKIFEKVGKVVEVVIIKDKFSGRSKGFGFVTMETEEDAKKAIAELNGKELDGRNLTVNEARPQKDRE